jgi:hypothetical protein
MFTEKWGDFYYGHNVGPNADSRSTQHWLGQLKLYQPDLKQRVERTITQWNLIVRDHLRNETALRLSIENKPTHQATQIPVRIVDGLPEPLIDALRHYNEQAPILLNEKPFTDTAKGLEIAINQFAAFQKLCPSELSPSDLANTHDWFKRILGNLQQFGIKDSLSTCFKSGNIT